MRQFSELRPTERIGAAVEGLGATVEGIGAAVENNTVRIGQLVDVCLSLANNIEAGFREVKEIQVATDYKLNAFIETVDKIVRNGHKPQ